MKTQKVFFSVLDGVDRMLFPDSKVHVAHMGHTWVLSASGGPHVGPMNIAIRIILSSAVGTFRMHPQH